MSELLSTSLAIVVLSIPLALSVWALLDATRRPAWAWALADRRQVLWIAVVLFGFLMVLPGVAIALWYLLRVRPEVQAAEQGHIRIR